MSDCDAEDEALVEVEVRLGEVEVEGCLKGDVAGADESGGKGGVVIPG